MYTLGFSSAVDNVVNKHMFSWLECCVEYVNYVIVLCISNCMFQSLRKRHKFI